MLQADAAVAFAADDRTATNGALLDFEKRRPFKMVLQLTFRRNRNVDSITAWDQRQFVDVAHERVSERFVARIVGATNRAIKRRQRLSEIIVDGKYA